MDVSGGFTILTRRTEGQFDASSTDHRRLRPWCDNLETPNSMMIFILAKPFSESRPVKKCLESFYGVGPNLCSRLMARNYIYPTAKVGSLSNKQTLDLNAELATLNIENDLRRQIRENIGRLRDMGSYRGRRHAMGLPVRGQRTRTQTSTAAKLNKVERKG